MMWSPRRVPGCECARAEVDLAAARKRMHVARDLGAVEMDDDIVEALAKGALHVRPRGFGQRLRSGVLVRFVWPERVHLDAVLVCEQLAITCIERIEVAHCHGQAGLVQPHRFGCTCFLGLLRERPVACQARELFADGALVVPTVSRPMIWSEVRRQRDLARCGGLAGEP